MRLPALAIAAALLSTPVHAENLAIGCPLLAQYSDSQVHYLLGEARSIIGEQETSRIYSKYVSLKSACQVDQRAVRVVSVSPTLRNWLAQNGVDIRSFGRLL